MNTKHLDTYLRGFNRGYQYGHLKKSSFVPVRDMLGMLLSDAKTKAYMRGFENGKQRAWQERKQERVRTELEKMQDKMREKDTERDRGNGAQIQWRTPERER